MHISCTAHRQDRLLSASHMKLLQVSASRPSELGDESGSMRRSESAGYISLHIFPPETFSLAYIGTICPEDWNPLSAYIRLCLRSFPCWTSVRKTKCLWRALSSVPTKGSANAGGQSVDAASPSEAIPPDAPSTPIKSPQLGSHVKEETSPIVESLASWHPVQERNESSERNKLLNRNTQGIELTDLLLLCR